MNMINRKTRKPAYIASPQLIKRACDAVEQGLTITQAAQSINVSTATLYRWIATDPQIKEQIDAAKERLHLSALEALLKAANLKQDWRGYAWVLERTFPERYAVRCKRCGELKTAQAS